MLRLHLGLVASSSLYALPICARRCFQTFSVVITQLGQRRQQFRHAWEVDLITVYISSIIFYGCIFVQRLEYTL